MTGSSREIDRIARMGFKLLILTLALWMAPGGQSSSPAIANSVQLSQPPNVGDAKIAATEYYKSGAYQRDLATITSEARAWLALRAPEVTRPALVLDIDDTALSNWEVIMADDFGRVFDGPCDALPKGPCGWVAWDLRGKTPVIAETMSLFKQARASGVAVFFITGRDETQRAATEENLRMMGYGDYEGLHMVPIGAHFASASDFKAPQREKIEKSGFTIIANVGDQPSDLAGGHAEKTFLLPNPYYRIP